MTVRIECLPSMYGYTESVDEERRHLDPFSEMVLLDELSEERIDECTKLLAETLETPVAFTTLTNSRKSWSYCSSGVQFTDIERNLCLQAQVLGVDEVFITADLESDPHFEHHPAVSCPSGVRFFAGAVLFGANGNIAGICCVIDYRRRHLTSRQLKFLKRTLKMIERELQSQDIITELGESIKSQALRDPSTKLPNLSLFYASLDRCLDCKKTKGRSYVVATIRLARYDMLANAVGRVGTAYLIGIAVDRIKSCLGSHILVGQIREDELVIASSYTAQQTHYAQILGDIGDCFKEPVRLGNESFSIAVEIGASRYPLDSKNSAELVRKARIALRSTETSGRFEYRLYQQSLAAQSDKEFRLESALISGMSRGEFSVVYQPIIDLSTRRIAGAEALMRWNSRDLGEVPPGVFIPIAEGIGVLSKLGNYVTATVCENLSRWQSAGLHNMNVSINISASQLRDPEFLDDMVQLIDEHNIDGSRLTLEITEGALIEDPLQAIETMNCLRAKSISFSIDDFGTGFSSLNYLRMMPLDILKIDRSFIANIPGSANDSSIAQSVIALGHSLGLKVVAEGVENFVQLGWLRGQECDEVQGYVFSEPLRVERFEELIRQNPLFSMVDRVIRVV